MGYVDTLLASIEEDELKANSQKTQERVREEQKQEKQLETLQEFDPHEIETIRELFNELTKSRKAKTQAKQVRSVVPIDKWIEDEYYVGLAGLALYPYWKKVLIDVFTPDKDGNPKYNELIFTGGIGIGKTTAGLYAMIRKLYELSCYENIPSLFHLMPNTLISILYFSVNKAQADLTGFGQIKAAVDSIPYFREHFLRNERINSLMAFPENVLIVAGSGTQHAIGMNMIGAILDEANFFQNGAQDVTKTQQEFGKISTLYTSIVNRGASRFKGYGRDDSLCVLISSNTTAASFTDQRVKESRGDPKVKVINARLWDVKPDGAYSKKRFYVFKGSDTIDPFIVDVPEDVFQITDHFQIPRPKGASVSVLLNGLPDIYKEMFVDVPEDFRRQFENDIIQSLQDIAGISVASTGKLFSNKIAYNSCLREWIKHPFTKEQVMISTNDSIVLKDFLRKDFIPLNRNFKRYIHIDQSLTGDSTGIASCYVARTDDRDGCFLPVVRIEFMLRINPPKKPKKISIAKIRDFIFFMRDVWELEIGKITYDTYASPDSIQIMQENGLPAESQSVDRSDEAYLSVVNMIYDGRLEFYQYPQFEKELFELIHYREQHKVDHPTNGSKDVCDAVVGAVYNAITSENVSAYNNDDVKSAINTLAISSFKEDSFSIDELLGFE